MKCGEGSPQGQHSKYMYMSSSCLTVLDFVAGWFQAAVEMHDDNSSVISAKRLTLILSHFLGHVYILFFTLLILSLA